MGPWRPAKDRSRDVLAFCILFHQNQRNINEMAAFQSLALKVLKNERKWLQHEELHHLGIVLLSCKYKIRAHTQRHTQIQSHTLSLTQLTHSPTHPPTHPITNFNAISVSEAGRFWAHGGLQKTDLETYLHFASCFIKIGQILTKWQRFKVWPLNY